MSKRPGLALAAVFLSLLAILAIAILPKREDAPLVRVEHKKKAPEETLLPRDPREEFVYELEHAIEKFRVAVTQEAPDQIADCFAPGFEGDTIFDLMMEEQIAQAPHVVVTRRARGPGGPLADRIRKFYGTVDQITFFGTKVADAERKGDTATATIKWSLHARSGEGRVHLQERYGSVLSLLDGRWKISKMERLDGRRVVSDRPLFETVDLGVPVDIDCHSCAYKTPQVHLGGVAAGDVDGDGIADLFTVGPAKSHLFILGKDETIRAGLGRGGSGCLFFDADGDADLDLLVTRLDENQAIELYRNKGNGTFELAPMPKIGGNAYSACAADIDNDGDLDLYVAFYGGPKIDVEGHVAYGLDTESFLDAKNGEPDVLLRNDGGTFTDITAQSGIKDTGWTLACGFQDYDNDGDPDLYVVHDFGLNTLWRNDGGKFTDVTGSETSDAGFGMGLARADYDADGDVDIYVSNMSSTAGTRIIAASKGLPDDLRKRMSKASAGNTLLRNDGAKFENAADASGVGKAGWAWGCVFTDFDNDGRPDLYVANGFVSGRHRTDL